MSGWLDGLQGDGDGQDEYAHNATTSDELIILILDLMGRVEIRNVYETRYISL